MMCYKDRTYCQFNLLCKLGLTCDRALTDNIKQKAEKFGLPICQFVNIPECFIPFFKESK